MSAHAQLIELLLPRPRGLRGEIADHEKWWADRQKALEQAGYMLRPRYLPGRKFSWAGTDKSYLDFEDGQPLRVSVIICWRRLINGF